MSERPYPFTEGSFWLTPPSNRQPPLVGRQRCDVAVIGGGYTGLAAALRLREGGVDVAVVERDFCGSGASGQNAGHVAPTIGKDVSTCIRMFGQERGLRFVRFAERAVECFEETIARHRIDCDYHRTGNILAGVHERQRRALVRGAESASRLGLHLGFLDETGMRRRGLPPAFRFGILESCGGTMHPGKYVLGLRAAAIAAGIRIHEDSRVTQIGQGSTITLETKDGVLEAPQALLATNAYTPGEFGLLGSRIMPVRVSQFATRPLTEGELARLGWRDREGIYTAHEILENYRLTVDHRIVGGSKAIDFEYGGRLAPGYQPATFALVERAFRERFPGLAAAAIETFWGGWVTMTLDFLPIWGRLGPHRNLAYYTGCNGHGVSLCTLMGSAVADELMGKRSEHTELLERFGIPLPPEPLRTALLHAINGVLAGLDRRLDRRVRRETATDRGRG